jgi:adenylate kinase
MVVLFLGPSGSGKDTQAELLRDKLGFEVVSTGQLLRDEIEKGSELGEKARESLEQGLWTPDEIVYEIVVKHIQETPADNFILTGAIRRATQISLLDELLEKINDPVDLVINFKLSEECAIDRLSRRLIDPKTGRIYHEEYNKPPEGLEVVRRKDDQPDAIRSRLQEFNKNNESIIQVYKARGISSDLDASKSIEEIHSEILHLITTNEAYGG